MKTWTLHTALLVVLMGTATLSGCRRPDPAVELSPIVDRYVEIWNTGNLEGIEEILHPEFELRMTPKFEPEIGIEAFKESIARWRTAYPDFHIDLDEIFFAGDVGAVRWTITATNSGPGWFPPTGKTVKVPGMSIFHFKQGKLKDEWIGGNNGYWLRQLGFELVPPKPADPEPTG
ncbi:MAG: ester cyclase [Bacteroidota bacterium]